MTHSCNVLTSASGTIIPSVTYQNTPLFPLEHKLPPPQRGPSWLLHLKLLHQGPSSLDLRPHLLHMFHKTYHFLILICCCSVTKSCPTPCDPMDCSTPGSSALLCPYPPEFTQTHVHWVGDTIWPSSPLSSPSHFHFTLSQHQNIFQWVSSSHQVAKILELQLQHQSSNEYSGLISLRIYWFDLFAIQGTLKCLL